MMLEPGKLKDYQKNARKHPKEQIDQIIKSIRDYGFNVPVECNASFVILSGHARVKAVVSGRSSYRQLRAASSTVT